MNRAKFVSKFLICGAILGTSLMAPFHSFKSLGTAAHCGDGLRRQAGCAWACLSLCVEMGFYTDISWEIEAGNSKSQF